MAKSRALYWKPGVDCLLSLTECEQKLALFVSTAADNCGTYR
jgi:hypothetical protein